MFIRSSFFCDVTQCRLVVVYRLFRIKLLAPPSRIKGSKTNSYLPTLRDNLWGHISKGQAVQKSLFGLLDPRRRDEYVFPKRQLITTNLHVITLNTGGSPISYTYVYCLSLLVSFEPKRLNRWVKVKLKSHWIRLDFSRWLNLDFHDLKFCLYPKFWLCRSLCWPYLTQGQVCPVSWLFIIVIYTYFLSD
jgi:hypothetical protein